MALNQAIEQARRQTATRANRQRQQRAEVRMDEIVSVAAIAGDYEQADRDGDLTIQDHFQSLYHLVDSEEEREAVARAFAVWQKCEQAEERALRGSVDESVDLLRTNNDFWLNGALTPDGDGGAA